jgi:hypothetical protein
VILTSMLLLGSSKLQNQTHFVMNKMLVNIHKTKSPSGWKLCSVLFCVFLRTDTESRCNFMYLPGIVIKFYVHIGIYGNQDVLDIYQLKEFYEILDIYLK